MSIATHGPGQTYVHTNTTTHVWAKQGQLKSKLVRGVSFWNNHCNLCWGLQRLHLPRPHTAHGFVQWPLLRQRRGEGASEGEEEREREEWWSTAGAVAAVSALFPLTQHYCFLMTPVFGVFLQAVFSYFAGRCRFFCEGGSQVLVKEKVGETGGGGGTFWFGSSKGFFKMLTLSLSVDEMAFIIHGQVWVWPPLPSVNSQQLCNSPWQWYSTAGTAHWKIL